MKATENFKDKFRYWLWRGQIFGIGLAVFLLFQSAYKDLRRLALLIFSGALAGLAFAAMMALVPESEGKNFRKGMRRSTVIKLWGYPERDSSKEIWHFRYLNEKNVMQEYWIRFDQNEEIIQVSNFPIS
jgi:cell division protein FtsW (lipid II flippase)